MSKYIFDTSFISAFFNQNDVNHNKAKEILSKISPKEEIIVPTVVIAELASFNKNKALRDVMVESVIDMSKSNPGLNESNLEDYIYFIKTIIGSFTAIDSIILFTAILYNADLITFDIKLKKLYTKHINIR